MEEKLSEITEPRNFDLSSFARAKEKMIATNDNSYQSKWDGLRSRLERVRDYSREEIESIINSGSLSDQQRLSRNYFMKDGYYKQIIIYYATLLKYSGLLIPNPGAGKNLSTHHISKRYYSAMDFVEQMQLPVVATNMAIRALIDGSYFGLKIGEDKKNFQFIDLPSGYACSRFKDIQGNDVVEFDVSYFRTINDKQAREDALAVYPKVISKAYRAWENGKRDSKWVIVPREIGICFPFFDGRPLFLSVIPATIDYDEAVEIQKEKDLEEIRKILVQKIPHLSDGRLLFEPDEALEIHQGSVGMMKGNSNVRVLTTYADVDAITSKTSADRVESSLDRSEKSIYSQAGVSSQIFSPTGNGALESSLNNDLALMMYFANKVSHYITNTINDIYANGNVSFKYTILPITYYNTASFVDTSFKLVGSGYSALMPAIAMGLSQRDLVNIKDLENDVLKLGDKLKPLSTSYTQTAADKKTEDEGKEQEPVNTDIDEGGRPKLKQEEKAETTIERETTRDKTGGS